MPTDPLYVPPRAEPAQLAPGETRQLILPYSVAAIAINNYTEFFAFIEPSNRPGFWVNPYQTGMIVNLYPPATSIRVVQSLQGPSGTSGVISNFGAGSIDLLLFDAAMSPDPGIITGPEALYEEATFPFDVAANFGSNVPMMVAGPTENLIIKRLAISPDNFSSGGLSLPILLSTIDIEWSEIPPPAPPFQPFSWNQAISQESPYASDVFETGSAVIRANDALTIAGSYENFGYYVANLLTTIVHCQVQFFRVNA